MVLELRDICKDYARGKIVVPVLENINLTVEEGEYIAIMGPSGSGKTTLMNLIGCLDQPTSGKRVLKGEDLDGVSDNRLADIRNRQIGFVFQNADLLPGLTALDNVALPLIYRGVRKKERRARAREMLELVGLEDRMDHKPNQLSGGQCQRVAIARAMVGNPSLLLADEPTGALDTKSGGQIMELFHHLNASGVTIIMITHAPEVASCAHKTYLIRDGKIDAGRSPARQEEGAR
ncbi:MAG: ABC transporter ATP-binding protein [Clostridiales bacterium]|nr:ABC transporter ATP-binding protein [Clostridiales bacterium]